MDGLQLRDEAVRDRIRAAEEFLDPSKTSFSLASVTALGADNPKATSKLEATGQILF
jgi:hypothetical protein